MDRGRRFAIAVAVLALMVTGHVTSQSATGQGQQIRVPPTALCRDGYYSFSQNCSGTCSYHGGVAVWYNRHCGRGRGAAPQGTPPTNVFQLIQSYQAPLERKRA
jgi:hypothetical protein